MSTINIYDLSNNPLSLKNGFYGGTACNKDGILIDDDEWIVKYPRSLSQMEDENASYSSLSEFLGSEIYRILRYDVHKTILGVRNNKLIVACKDFAIDGFLLEIRTIKNYLSGDLLDKFRSHSNIHSTSTHVVDIDELMFHLEKNPLLNVIDGIKQHFFEQALIDIFINNNDRTNDNWGILRINGQKDRIAPIFDNGASFSPKMSEDIGMQEVGAFPDEVENEIKDLLAEINSWDGDVLLAAAYFHARFENIHPFADGNGRTGRLLLNYYLLLQNYPPLIISTEDKNVYYLALEVYDRTEEISGLKLLLEEELNKTWQSKVNKSMKKRLNKLNSF